MQTTKIIKESRINNQKKSYIIIYVLFLYRIFKVTDILY